MDVLGLVESVTDEQGANRAERKKRTYPKIAAGGHRSVTLKLADRIANVEASILGGCGFDFLSMYKAEYADFKKALGEYGHMGMWCHLDSLLL